MRYIAPHTLILSALLTLGACTQSSDAPTPKSEATEATKTETVAQTENEKLDAWFEQKFLESVSAPIHNA